MGLVGFGEMERHFEAEAWRGGGEQASRARLATVGKIVSLYYGILWYVDYEMREGQ